MQIFFKHRRKLLFSGMVALGLVFLLGMAQAHGINVFAWVEGDKVHAQAKLGDGRKAKNAPITVYNNRGIKLLEGKTDTNGDFSFPVPGKSDLKIVLETGTGHRAEWILSAAEIEGNAEFRQFRGFRQKSSSPVRGGELTGPPRARRPVFRSDLRPKLHPIQRQSKTGRLKRFP